MLAATLRFSHRATTSRANLVSRVAVPSCNTLLRSVCTPAAPAVEDYSAAPPLALLIPSPRQPKMATSQMCPPPSYPSVE